jgi:quercetin dioxygenase-like cupin family protein
MILSNVAASASFRPDKMGKVDLAGGQYLYAGLNCFEPGQQHAAHIHADQDKLYLVMEGQGIATVGDEQRPVSSGDLVLAPAGVEHAMQAGADTRLVVLVVFGPPPQRRG